MLLPICLLIVTLLAAPAAGAPAGAGRAVEYDAPAATGVARLITSPNASSLLFRIDHGKQAEVGVAEQARLLQPLLGQYLARYNDPRRFFVVFRDTADLFRRIAQSARRSAAWNSKAGRPRRSTVSAFIVHEVNSRHLAGELERCFAAFGYALKASSAEQVIIDRTRGEAVPVSGSLAFIAEKEGRK